MPFVRRFLLLVVLLAGLVPALLPAGAAARPVAVSLRGGFADFWRAHEGTLLFGAPLTGEQPEGGLTVQYFERARLEWHADYPPGQQITLGRLGAELIGDRVFPGIPPFPSNPAHRYFAATGHSIQGAILTFWQAHGGLPIFGYPISEEFMENGHLTQWFERARFELHPENQPPYDVLLGLLGREATAYGDPDVYDVGLVVGDGPTHDRRLVLGLAQGGESTDPDFLSNVIPQARELQPAFIRVDNVFNHYDVVSRDGEGHLQYHFGDLDRVIDNIRAVGAQPYICLSYTPAVLSPGGQGIDPPASLDEWRELVTQTVQHFNGARGLGIKYWEVWNEPNLDNAWTGSYEDYLRLYDASRDGLVAVDPHAAIGGPTVSTLDVTAPDWLMGWEETQGAPARVDFVSWHAYGHTPDQLAAEVASVREVVAKHPAFHPELIISEFSVATGGPNDTSQGGRSDGSGAGAYALSALAALERAGLDKALMFELKDGAGPSRYWGRWGLLTNDGQAKPAYYAIDAYQHMQTGLLPVGLTTAPGSGVDLLASRDPAGTVRLLLWNAGVVAHRAHIELPPALASRSFRVTLFDSTHNNFAAQGDDQLARLPARPGEALVFDLEPDSFAVLNSP